MLSQSSAKPMASDAFLSALLDFQSCQSGHNPTNINNNYNLKSLWIFRDWNNEVAGIIITRSHCIDQSADGLSIVPVCSEIRNRYIRNLTLDPVQQSKQYADFSILIIFFFFTHTIIIGRYRGRPRKFVDPSLPYHTIYF